jgi:nucleoid-associated protein YgaU
MSIFSALGTSSGMVVGGVAVVGAVAVAAIVVVATNDAESPPEVGRAPVQVSTPRVDAVARGSEPLENSANPLVEAPRAPEIEPVGKAPVVVSTATAKSDTDEPVEETVSTDPAARAPVVDDETVGLAVAGIDASDVSVGFGGDTSISATDAGNRVVASLEPTQDAQPATNSVGKPKTANVIGGVGPSAAIQIDLVRIDKAGSAIVAGKAPRGAEVEIYVDGEVIAEIVADTKGGFVALFDVPPSQDAQVMTMALRDAAGNSIPSSDRVFIKGREVVAPDPAAADTAEKVLPVDEVAPQVIIASDEGIKIVQPASFEPGAPEVMSNVSLDLISYDTEGEVVLAGRGKVKNYVRIYVDDTPVRTQPIAADGSWQLSLPEVDAGIYTLRIDEIDNAGKVVSRVETPFKKEEPTEVRKVASVADPVVKSDVVAHELKTVEVSPSDVAIDGVDGDMDNGLDDSVNGLDGSVVVPKIIDEPKTVLAKLVTIQPGATLWELAEARYGQGNLYMQIFEANRDNIRNPDLIYPGQIFTIPE